MKIKIGFNLSVFDEIVIDALIAEGRRKPEKAPDIAARIVRLVKSKASAHER